jgi:UDP-4-amino-4,6-dideoxy-N-acetyl-beta-L-altrosamine N-acetyltransferase
MNLDDKEKEIVREWRNHADIKKWMYSDHIISNEEHARFIGGLKKDKKNIYWLAKDKSGGYPGVISLNRVDFSNKNAYLGIYTNPYNVKRGTGYVLIECLKVLAFDKANLHTLKLEVIERNNLAISFYKKAGFCEEGRLRDFVFRDGRWCDVIVMGIMNKDVGQTWNSE